MAKATFNIIEGAKAIDTAIKSIATRGKRLERDIHVAAVACLVHADKHGDVTLAQKLVDAIPSLARKNALRDWFIAHGKFDYDATNKTLAFNKKGTTLVEEAIATPFWEFKQEAEYVAPTDEAVHKRIAQVLKFATQEGSKVSKGTIDKLQSLVA